jgi:hypothetical protein
MPPTILVLCNRRNRSMHMLAGNVCGVEQPRVAVIALRLRQ